MNFANRMRQLRIESNTTTQELADKLKVARTTVSNWENGNRSPDFEMLKKIAQTLQSSTDYLLGVSDIRNPYVGTDKPTTEDNNNTDDNHKEDEIITIAAHHEGGEFTEEDLKQIEDFKQYVLSKKSKK